MKKLALFLTVSAVAILVVCSYLLFPNSGEQRNTGKRIIRDMTGRRVVVPDDVKRVVTAMYPIATQLMFLVGAQEMLAAISDMDVNDAMVNIYSPITSIYRPVMTNHGDINKEELLKMHPDIVFTHTKNARDSDFSQLGIATVCLKLETPDQLIEGIELVGRIVNRSERARAVAGYYRRKLEYIRSKTALVKKKKKVYFCGPAMLSAAGGDMYQNFFIEYAGGENVARQIRGGWCSVSIEHLLSWNPDLIFIGNYGTAKVENFTKDSRLSEISAVKNNKVFMSRFFIGSWDIPTPESILGIMWLANKLYPGEVNFDMAAEMEEFYQTCYGYRPGKKEIARVLEAP
ncbi:MAG: High-affinity heme uptake system protein IsdE precursor [Syntrophus sp. PtaB.Bin001]|nr:MAG: High-affinity heme uptake system protein IsdE precursor [Syntrophus sp. PtaB.Bin001]